MHRSKVGWLLTKTKLGLCFWFCEERRSSYLEKPKGVFYLNTFLLKLILKAGLEQFTFKETVPPIFVIENVFNFLSELKESLRRWNFKSHQRRIQGMIGQNFTAERKYLQIIFSGRKNSNGTYKMLDLARFRKFSWNYKLLLCWTHFCEEKDKFTVNLRLNVFSAGFNLPLVSRETTEEF